jgi:N6-L-threonylcarbamoyladenine synthase
VIILGIETSCDETAAAVMELKPRPRRAPEAKLLANRIASQHEIHAPYGGVFPELASRRHIEVIQPLVAEALKIAQIASQDLDGIAVTNRPGLVGSLLVGLSFAKSYAYGLGIPFLGVNHLEGHLHAPMIEHPEISYPHIGLIVSGGHTALYLVKGFADFRFLGGTRDDAAGEAFDKVAKILGLGYPGGPIVDKMAKSGNASAFRFTKPKMPRYDFSFSGLKTAVKSVWEKEKNKDSTFLQNVCASFQETAVDILIEKTLAAAKAYRCKTVLVTGGVACNSRLREKMKEAAIAAKRSSYFASPILSTDNAAMIAYVGGRRLMSKEHSPLDLNALANLDLAAS